MHKKRNFNSEVKTYFIESQIFGIVCSYLLPKLLNFLPKLQKKTDFSH